MVKVVVQCRKHDPDQLYHAADPKPGLSIGYPTPGLLNLELLAGVNGLIVGTSCICSGSRVCRLNTASLAN